MTDQDKYTGIAPESAAVFRLADAREREAKVAQLARELFVAHGWSGTPSMLSMGSADAFRMAEWFIEAQEARWEALK